MKMITTNRLLSLLSPVTVSLYPCLVLYFANNNKMPFTDILGISFALFFAGLALLGGMNLVFRDLTRAALLANLLLLIFLYFAPIEQLLVGIFPALYYWHILLICLFIVVQAGVLIHSKISPETAHKSNLVFLAVFGGLIAYNSLLAVPVVFKGARAAALQAVPEISQPSPIPGDPQSASLPNVYLFIFDEYAGYDGLLRYTGFDNSGFYSSLEELGFLTSRHSRNNTLDTYTEIPNLLHLQEINAEDMLETDKKENFKDPYLLALMKRSGYAVNALDSTNYDFIDSSYTDYRFSEDFVSTFGSFESYIIRNTVFYPFYGAADQDNEMREILLMFDYASQSSRLQENNLFTIGYFVLPHLPYIFDENGGKTSYFERTDLADPQPYLAQFKFTSAKILELVGTIIENDPQSVIILQSDHGYRLPSHRSYWYGDDSYDLETEARYMQNILNAVYFRWEYFHIDGLSGLDTLKVVLDRLGLTTP